MTEQERKRAILKKLDELISKGKEEEGDISQERVDSIVNKLANLVSEYNDEAFLDVMENISVTINVLRVYAFSVSSIIDMMETTAEVFVAPINKQIFSILNSYISSLKQVIQIVKRYPIILGLTNEQIEHKFQLLSDCGFEPSEIEKLLAVEPRVLLLKPEVIRAQIPLLRSKIDKAESAKTIKIGIIDFETLLSLVSGRMYTNSMKKVTDAINYMAEDTVDTMGYTFLSVFETVQQVLQEKYPQIGELASAEQLFNPDERRKFIAEQKAIFGDSFQLEPMQDEIVRRLGEQTGKGQL